MTEAERLAACQRGLRAAIAGESPRIVCAALAIILAEEIAAAPRGTRVEPPMISSVIRAVIIARDAAPQVQ